MKRRTRKSAEPLSRSDKLEFVIEHRFEEVLFEDLEVIDEAIQKGATPDEAIQALMDNKATPPLIKIEGLEEETADEREQYAADLKAARAFMAELRSDEQLDALYQEIKEQEQQRQEAAREAARFFNQPEAKADLDYWVQLEFWSP